MKSITTHIKRHWTLGLGILVATVLMLASSSAIRAHEAPCPFCKLTLVQNTAKIDNEVVLQYGNKKIEYRCIYCAFADQDRYKGDITVQAPSEKKGSPIIIKRVGGKWTAPDSTVFISSFKRHKTCAVESRAFTSLAAFNTYVKETGISDAKPLTLAEELANVAKKVKTDQPATTEAEHQEGEHMDADQHDDQGAVSDSSREQGEESEHDNAAVTYTCPMHLNVTSDKPGKCPTCGMALVEKK